MKRYLLLIAMLLVTLSSGCSVWQAERNFKIAKLERATIEISNTATIADVKKNGIISNMDRYRPIRVVISDESLKEKKSYFLAPGQLLIDFLTDGKYTATVYRENRLIDVRDFNVSINTHNYMGNSVYWYIAYNNGY